MMAFSGKSLLQWLAVILMIACLALLVVQPFTLKQMPQTADGELLLYRLVALDYSLQHEGLWARYSTGLAAGYGAPLFNFFSPAVSYVPELFHLAGMSFVQAWTWGMAFYIFLAGMGAYLLGRRWLGMFGGVISAVAYIYAPYVLFDAVARGTISEVAALALLPWVMWAFTRLAAGQNWRNLLLTVLLYSAFILIHPIITLQGTTLLLLYCLFLWLTSQNKRWSLIYLLAGGVLALLMTAFFWLPALAETDQVQINQVTQFLPQVDVTNHLRELNEVFALPFTADPTQLQAPIPISLGWGQIILTVIALGFALWRIFRRGNAEANRLERRIDVFVLLSIALNLFLIFLNTPASAWLWENIPLMAYSQFPWRVMGLSSLLLALTAGAGAVYVALILRREGWRLFWGAVCVIFMMLTAIPWLYSVYLPELQPASIADTQAHERETGQFTLASYSEYLPSSVEKMPDPFLFAESFSPNIDRLQPNEAVNITESEWHPTSANLQIQADDPATLIFNWLYVPGWTAQLQDDTGTIPLEVQPSDVNGLVLVHIPSGEGQLTISLGRTAIQTTAEWLSLLGIVLLVLMIAIDVFLHRRKIMPVSQYAPSPVAVPVDAGKAILLFSAIGIGMFLFKAVLVDAVDSPLKRERFADGVGVAVGLPLETNFNNEITLLGVDIGVAAESGGSLPITLYWSLRDEAIPSDYSSIVQLHDLAGNVVTSASSFMPGEIATSNWIPGTYVQERLLMEVPPGTPPLPHTLDVGLFHAGTIERIPVINLDGNPEDVKVEIGSVNILPPQSPSRFEGVDRIPLNEDLALLTPELDLPDTVTSGEELQPAFTWEALTDPSQAYSLQLLWLEGGNVVGESRIMPLVAGYPTNEWRANDIWTGQQRLFVPGNLPDGEYTLVLQLLDAANEAIADPVQIQQMRVTAPDRNYELPEMQTDVSAEWVNGVHLFGYDTVSENEIRLYWGTDELLDESLRLFVHVIGENEQILAQTDGVPVDWSRPTTGWDVGEIIATSHVFEQALPGFEIRIGWYDPITGERIPLNDGGDFLILE